MPNVNKGQSPYSAHPQQIEDKPVRSGLASAIARYRWIFADVSEITIELNGH
jgi:hypothetical protein